MKKSKIDSLEDAFRYTDRDPKLLPIVDHLPEDDRDFPVDSFNLMVLVDALNKESNGGKPWQPKWGEEYKYEPRFWVADDEKDPSGFVFTNSIYCDSYARAGCGSRFDFHSVDALQHAQKKFSHLFHKVIVRKKK